MKTNIINQISIPVLGSIIALMLSYMVGYAWMEGGFSKLELAMFTLVPGFIFFASMLLFNTMGLIRYYQFNRENDQANWPWWKSLLLILAVTIAGTIGFDYTFALLVDNSLPQAFGEAVMGLGDGEGHTQPAAVKSAFINLPLFMQGLFMNLSGLVMGQLISTGIARIIWSRFYQDDLNYLAA